jgi:hypothetical protein
VLSQEHPSSVVPSSKFQVEDSLLTLELGTRNLELEEGGAGGVEPLTSAFTEPRAIRYTTGRISVTRNSDRGTRNGKPKSRVLPFRIRRSAFRASDSDPGWSRTTDLLHVKEAPSPLGHGILRSDE